MVAAAVIGAGVVGAVGSSMAAGKQADGQKQASDTQLGMFDTITKQQQPFRQAGVNATNKLSDMLGTSGKTDAQGYGSLASNFTPADFQANKDPGYDFQLKQGESAVRNADTPNAGALSGGTLKDLMSFNQGMASTGYNNAFNRFQQQNNNIFSRLSGIAGMGQNAAANTGTAGTQLGIGAGQAQAGAGASLAGGIVGATNSIGSSTMLAGLLSNQGGTPKPTWGPVGGAPNYNAPGYAGGSDQGMGSIAPGAGG